MPGASVDPIVFNVKCKSTMESRDKTIDKRDSRDVIEDRERREGKRHKLEKCSRQKYMVVDQVELVTWGKRHRVGIEMRWKRNEMELGQRLRTMMLIQLVS